MFIAIGSTISIVTLCGFTRPALIWLQISDARFLQNLRDPFRIMLGPQTPMWLERFPSRAEYVAAAEMGADRIVHVVHGDAVSSPDLIANPTASVLTSFCCRNVEIAGELESGAGSGRLGWGWQSFVEGDFAVDLQGVFIERGELRQLAVITLMEFKDECHGC